MTVLCDTSVFVAGISTDHVHHAVSLRFLKNIQNGKIKGSVSSHSLAECYAVLSALHVSHLPQIVFETLRENLKHFDLISLDGNDYWKALTRVVSKNLRSGAIFDALIFQAALKKRVTHLATWNPKDFERLSDKELHIVTPDALC